MRKQVGHDLRKVTGQVSGRALGPSPSLGPDSCLCSTSGPEKADKTEDQRLLYELISFQSSNLELNSHPHQGNLNQEINFPTIKKYLPS